MLPRKKQARSRGFILLYTIILLLLSPSISAFELEIEDGVDKSMVEFALSRIPANATIGLKKIVVHAHGPKWDHNWLDDILFNKTTTGLYRYRKNIFTGKKTSEIHIYRASEELSDIFVFYDTLRHELGHHFQARHGGFTTDAPLFQSREDHDSDPDEIFADEFELLPKCGCPADWRYYYPNPSSEEEIGSLFTSDYSGKRVRSPNIRTAEKAKRIFISLPRLLNLPFSSPLFLLDKIM